MPANPCPIEPMPDRVVVRPLPGTRATPGGILLPDRVRSKKEAKVHEGIVAACGAGPLCADGTRMPAPVAPGDRVVYATRGGSLEWGDGWVLINQHDLLCRLED